MGYFCKRIKEMYHPEVQFLGGRTFAYFDHSDTINLVGRGCALVSFNTLPIDEAEKITNKKLINMYRTNLEASK